MKVIESSGPIKLVIVCCLHGDELIGERVFEYYKDKLDELDGIRLIFANEEAHAAKTRFIDDDLNRSFPGDVAGHHEQTLAAQIVPLVQDVRYVLDLHTTTTDVVMTPIVCNINDDVRQVINLTTSDEVALMPPAIAAQALIGHCKSGVSLEFNEDYATTDQALEDVKQVVEALVLGQPITPRDRKIYHIKGVIPRDIPFPKGAHNFDYIDGIGYPFLIGERAYKTHWGFVADQVEELTI